MIPTRVCLKNFLTFASDSNGSPITLEFDGAVLWSIAGINGAGKSAIFDAITYALYGEHRGGRQQDNRLIRKGANTAEVAFEFLQGGRRYRIERSVTRKFGRQGQVRPDAKHAQASMWDDTDEAWIAIPDTDKPTELERWVRGLLGMGPETFASSVLLRQGEADKLLTAKANQRFRILAGLIDLRAYQRLEQLAIDRRKTADATAAALDQQVADIVEVTDEQLAAAAKEFEEAEAAVKTADEERLTADRTWLGAQRHAELRQRHDAYVGRRDELMSMVERADSIRAAAAERSSLDTIIEPVSLALRDLADAETAAKEADDADRERDEIDLDGLEATTTARTDELGQAEQDLEGVSERHQLLRDVHSFAKEVVRCRRDHADRLARLETLGDPNELETQAEQVDLELAEAHGRLEQLEGRRAEAIGREGSAKAAVQTVEERLAALDDLAHEPTCSRCNQPITPEHLAAERALADELLAEAQAALQAEQDTLEQLATEIIDAKAASKALDTRHRATVAAVNAARTARDEEQRAKTQVDATIGNAPDLDEADEPASDLVAKVTSQAIDEAEDALGMIAALEQGERSAIAKAKNSRDAARIAAQSAQAGLEQARRRCAELEHVASVRRERAKQLTAQAGVRLQHVPPDISTSVRQRDRTILDRLNDRRVELADAFEHLENLEAAENELANVTAAFAELELELLTVAPEHQIPPTDARSLLDAAEAKLQDAQGRRDKSRDEHQNLKAAHRTRRQLTKKLAAARHDARLSRRLAALLGKAELQGRLLTEATAGVEAYANDALARISGGLLELELRRDDGGDGANLDIFVRDRGSADEPLEVAFISGSQKFRVAVALAAGLGQYLGGAAAIKALIVDEGFGSLDADGRQRMIDELRALSEHLDRIIVVSHQDDFADRTLFPNGFVLRKEGTQTVVERVG